MQLGHLADFGRYRVVPLALDILHVHGLLAEHWQADLKVLGGVLAVALLDHILARASLLELRGLDRCVLLELSYPVGHDVVVLPDGSSELSECLNRRERRVQLRGLSLSEAQLYSAVCLLTETY